MTGGTAWERHLRILATATSLGTIIFGALALPAIIEQANYLLPQVFVPLTVAFCGLPIALAPVARWGSIRAIQWIARAHVGVAALLLAVWAPSMTSAGLPNGQAPWVLNTLAVGVATAVIGFSGRVAWACLIGLCLGGIALRYVVLGDGFVLPLQDGVSMFSFSAVIAAILLLSLSSGRRQDDLLASSLEDARLAAESQSLARQRARLSALVHDDMITTLVSASRDDIPRQALRASAQQALTRLAEFAGSDADADPLRTASDVERDLRETISAQSAGIVVSGSLAAFETGVPREVASALEGAVSEAVRNSVRHAASPPRVHFAANPTTLTAEVDDDGPGFDPERIPVDRLGIRSSIIDRVSVYPGGSASVMSQPGSGTKVVLTWDGARQ